jgi:hypothetical protein
MAYSHVVGVAGLLEAMLLVIPEGRCPNREKGHNTSCCFICFRGLT